jgi:SAM-dependent methyltransferase
MDAASPADRSWAARQAKQAGAYDRIGERYDEAFRDKDPQVSAVDRLLAELGSGAAVLDLGCGTGLPTSRQLAEAGCRVTGVDFAPAMVELARRNVPEARFLTGDIADPGRIEGLDPPYDAVVAFFALLHLPRARIPGALAGIRRALVPGGRFCLSMVEADIDDEPTSFLGQRIRVTGFPRAVLRSVVEDAGFTVDAEEIVGFTPEPSLATPETQQFLTCRSPG